MNATHYTINKIAFEQSETNSNEWTAIFGNDATYNVWPLYAEIYKYEENYFWKISYPDGDTDEGYKTHFYECEYIINEKWQKWLCNFLQPVL